MFGYRVGFFSGTADLMALFLIRTNSTPPSWIISNGHISATAHDLLISRASRGHLCDSTAFLLGLANEFLADTARQYGRANTTGLRPSSVCDVMYCDYTVRPKNGKWLPIL